MAQVLINDTTLTEIASSLRTKYNTNEKFYPGELADMIDDIPQTINTITKNVTSFNNYYIISQENYENIDLSEYEVGDIIVVVPSLKEEK